MQRRTFFRSTLAAAAAASLPAARPLSAWTGSGVRTEAEVPRGFRVLRGRAPDLDAVTGDGREIVIPGSDVDELAARLRGPVLLAGDDGYDEARRILNPSFDKHPALIVQPTGTADIQAAVQFAAAYSLLTAVKCGGHSLSGKSTCDRGIQIDLSRHRDVRVDPAARRVRVTGGSLLGAVDHEAMAHGLVTPMGTVSHTGVGGLVTGGGFGRVARRFGLSIDNLVSVDVVAADGQLYQARADHNPDLFWGVRGGGGNFGVVTSFEFELHPMQRQVVAGSIVYPIERAADVVRLFGEYSMEAPDELDSGFFVSHPPADGPANAGFYFCWSGDAGRADDVLAPFRSLGTTVADTTEAIDYVALQRSGDIDDPRAQANYTKSGFVEEFPEGLILAIVEGIEGHPDRNTGVFYQQGGGAIARVSNDATAFAHRNVAGNLLSGVNWPFEKDAAEHVNWIKNFWTAIEPFTVGFYSNDLEIEHGTAAVNSNFGGNYGRLVEVKNRYDPNNLFRLNANVEPTA